MAVTRRLRKFAEADSIESVTDQMNGATANGFLANRGGMNSGERIVAVHKEHNYWYVFTEEITMGPTKP